MYETELFNMIARGNDKRTGYERVTGDTPNISEYSDYEFYDWVYNWDMPGDIDNPMVRHFTPSRQCDVLSDFKRNWSSYFAYNNSADTI